MDLGTNLDQAPEDNVLLTLNFDKVLNPKHKDRFQGQRDVWGSPS
jgi:hypothetical protein